MLIGSRINLEGRAMLLGSKSKQERKQVGRPTRLVTETVNISIVSTRHRRSTRHRKSTRNRKNFEITSHRKHDDIIAIGRAPAIGRASVMRITVIMRAKRPVSDETHSVRILKLNPPSLPSFDNIVLKIVSVSKSSRRVGEYPVFPSETATQQL